MMQGDAARHGKSINRSSVILSPMAKRTIAGSRVILTGASSGIGRALAAQLVGEGARVLAVARRRERLEELVRDLAGKSGQIEIFAGDVTSAEVRRAIVEQAVRALGGVDLLINNAGSGAMGHFAEASAERLRQVMEINFFAPTEMIRCALPALQSGNRPMIVNVSSVLGHRGVPFCAEYCASKFALQGLSESLRAELVPLGIDLLVVSPSRTETEFFVQAINATESRWPKLCGVPPQFVARRTLSAIRHGRHEIVLSAGGKLLVWANRLFPRILDGILARYM
jgi:short-subunit dehydrogenase